LKLTIITITYNAEQFLERTILSVANQTVQGFEYLIIDGGSKDRTLEIIKNHEKSVTRWISEKDKGIYDAMNKGLSLASGDFVWFMNAGDQIHDNQVVEKLLKTMEDNADVYYGETLFVNDNGENLGLRSVVTPHGLPKNLTWRDFRYGMVVCHQAFIARKTIAPSYRLDHFYSADIDWEIKCLKAAQKVTNLNITVAKYLTGGFSIKNLKRSLLDRYEILRTHFGFFGAAFAHVLILFRGLGFIWKKKGKYW
jgi:glycosyltransferase involved in cell wall biosynthesis